jgi:hypothetical protein
MKLTKLFATVGTGREVIGTVIASKLDGGKRFTITAVDAAAETVTLTEQLAEDATDEERAAAKVITVTKAMEDSFSYIMNPNPKPAPEIDLKDGKIAINGKAIPMGDIVVTKDLATQPDEALLIAEADGEKALYRYLVSSDKLNKLPFEIGEVMAEQVSSMTILTNTIIEDVPQADEDGNPVLDRAGVQVTKPKLVTVQVGQYQANGRITWTGAAPYDSDSSYEDDDEYGDEYDEYDEYDEEEYASETYLPVDSFKLVQCGTAKTLVATSSKKVDADGYLVDREGETAVYLIGVRTGEDRNGNAVETIFDAFPQNLAIKGSNPSVTVAYDGRNIGWVVKTSEELVLLKGGEAFRTEKADVIGALVGYNNYVGTFRNKEVNEDGGIVEVTKLKFAAEDYTSKAVVIRPLGDNRGADITVE